MCESKTLSSLQCCKNKFVQVRETHMAIPTIDDKCSTTAISIRDLADWRRATNGSRLLLPSIQRSLVWSNEQIVNYWDSLLRKYPPGMMMIYRVREQATGIDANGNTCNTDENDYQLFDGQQRVSAILLGLNIGELARTRKLWIDLRDKPNHRSGLKFQLRISSTGQPFGYRPDAPNQKPELAKRQERWSQWRNKHPDEHSPQYAFEHAHGSDLIDATCVVPLSEIYELLLKSDEHSVCEELKRRESADPDLVKDFVAALSSALETEVTLHRVPENIISEQADYIRFFERLGQGGTRLSDDELTYSMIKYKYPVVHDRMQEIMKGKAGRLADEVDLVLATLRVAKANKPWEAAKEWEIIGRPTPTFVSQLNERKEVEQEFLDMIKADAPPLEIALVHIREALVYHHQQHPEGLPPMLLTRLPRELVDTLLLFSFRRGTDKSWEDSERDVFRAFVLYWLLFIGNDAKAAWRAFQHSNRDGWSFSQESIRNLIDEYEKDSVARPMPRTSQMESLTSEAENRDYQLCPWGQRFAAADGSANGKTGEALRVLSTKRELIIRALMWLQRKYIGKEFPQYDPTSGRDEDLPIDLDHLVPQDVFAFDWRFRDARLEPDAISDNFYWNRGTIGNSLGNFRWIDAGHNRGRGKGLIEPLPDQGDLVDGCLDAFNCLIDAQKWSREHIREFQRLIDLRSLDLYQRLLEAIDCILPDAR